MAQYQQWLQYQEIHKRLSTEVETLEAELAKLQDYLDQLRQRRDLASFTDNPIIQALAAHSPSQPAPPVNNERYALETLNSTETSFGQSSETISPALRSWGGLPNFELHEMKEAFLADNQSPPLFNHPEIELLPEDMLAFFEEHEHTDPQLELPWWLRNITVSSKDEQAGRPIDHNSIRTNRLVQRWIERWGRQPSSALKTTNNKEEDSGE
jgi:hypothetical protein